LGIDILKVHQSKQYLDYMILKGISQTSLPDLNKYILKEEIKEIANSRDNLCSFNPKI
jgi:hypothetical protein